MVDVALPLEHDPKSVDTDPDPQSDESIVIVVKVVVPDVGLLVS